MKKITTKPYLYFFWLVPLFIILALTSKDKTIDISIYNIYFVASRSQVCLFSAIFFGMIGINYYSIHWAKKTPKKWLTIVHLLLQTISLISFVYSLLNINNSGNFISNSFFGLAEMKTILFISFLVFLLSVFIHLINFFISLLLKTD